MTRKEEIEQYIEKQTSLKITDNTFDFSNCNAYIISLDLNIDRTNVSRILNQLFIENRLIKVDGRPTLYISKAAIYENLSISSLPSSIKIGENLKDFLDITPSSHRPSQSKTEIIGIERNESLHSIFQRIASFIMSPFYSQPLCLILSGEKGTGRKYLVEQIFALAKKKKIFDSSQSIFYCFSMENTSIESICQRIIPKQNPMLLLQMYEINSKTKANLWSIAELYKNCNTSPPIIFILTNPNIENIEIFGIPSEIFNFPKLCNRSPKEIIELVLFFFLRLSKSFKREFYITKDILLLFSMKEYKHSHCAELYHHIYSFVSFCLYHSNEHKPSQILLDPVYIPSHFKSFLPDLHTYSTNDFSNLIPDTLILNPTMQLNDIKSITNNFSDKIFLATPEITNINISDLVFSHSSLLNPIKNKSSKLTHLLFDNLQTTILKKDPQLIYLISDIIQNFINDRISLLKYKISSPFDISSSVESIYKILMVTIRPYIKDFPITESEKYIIKQLISCCVNSIQETKIPILIICHENNVSNNYAHYFNMISKSRKYYCLNYSKSYQEKGIEFFTQKLLQIINLINRGKGVILLVDYYPLTTIDSKLVLQLRTPIFSFSPVSVSLLYTVNNSNKNEAIAIATTVIKNQNTDKSNLNNDNLIMKYERLNYPTLIKMKDLFPYLDTTKTNEYLYKSLVILSEKLHIKLNNSIIIEYIFHGNCILSNIHLKQRDYTASEILDEDIIKMIQAALNSQPIFSNIQFKNEELSILYNILHTNALNS